MRFFVNIWPIAVSDGYLDTILNEIKKEWAITSIHEIHLNYCGLRNYMIQIYRKEKWAGNFSNHFRGIPAKLNPCFAPDTPLYLVEFEADDTNSVLACKERIRKLCKHEKHSMHTSDTTEEYSLMKQILLHTPTIELMNRMELDRNTAFTKSFSRLLKMIEKHNLDTEDFLIVSKACYFLFDRTYGMSSSFFNRKKVPLSWITLSEKKLPPALDGMNGNEFYHLINDFSEEIRQPQNHVSYCGISFAHKDIIKKMEQIT